MPRNDLPLDFASKAVISIALGDWLGSILKEVFVSPSTGSPQVISSPRTDQRHLAITSLGASCPSDIRLTNFHVPSRFLDSFSAASSARVGDAKVAMTTPASQIDPRTGPPSWSWTSFLV